MMSLFTGVTVVDTLYIAFKKESRIVGKLSEDTNITIADVIME